MYTNQLRLLVVGIAARVVLRYNAIWQGRIAIRIAIYWALSSLQSSVIFRLPKLMLCFCLDIIFCKCQNSNVIFVACIWIYRSFSAVMFRLQIMSHALFHRVATSICSFRCGRFMSSDFLFNKFAVNALLWENATIRRILASTWLTRLIFNDFVKQKGHHSYLLYCSTMLTQYIWVDWGEQQCNLL